MAEITPNKLEYTKTQIDTAIKNGLFGDGSEIKVAVDAKQDKLVAGDGITLTNNTVAQKVISETEIGGAKISDTYAITATTDGTLKGKVKTNEDFNNAEDQIFISKGTLNNVISGQLQKKLSAGNGVKIDNSNNISAQTISVDDNTSPETPAGVIDFTDPGKVTFKPGNNITLTANTTDKTITITSTGGGGGSGDWSDVGTSVSGNMLNVHLKDDETGTSAGSNIEISNGLALDTTSAKISAKIPDNASGTGEGSQGFGVKINSDGGLISQNYHILNGYDTAKTSNEKGYKAIRSAGATIPDANYSMGKFAVALGNDTQAWGNYSFAGGNDAIAGNATASDGDCSFAFGHKVSADSNYSVAFGDGVRSLFDNQFSIGTYNEATADDAFTIGNGTSTASSNSFEIRKEGRAVSHYTCLQTDDERTLITKKYVDQFGSVPIFTYSSVTIAGLGAGYWCDDAHMAYVSYCISNGVPFVAYFNNNLQNSSKTSAKIVLNYYDVSGTDSVDSTTSKYTNTIHKVAKSVELDIFVHTGGKICQNMKLDRVYAELNTTKDSNITTNATAEVKLPAGFFCSIEVVTNTSSGIKIATILSPIKISAIESNNTWRADMTFTDHFEMICQGDLKTNISNWQTAEFIKDILYYIFGASSWVTNSSTQGATYKYLNIANSDSKWGAISIRLGGLSTSIIPIMPIPAQSSSQILPTPEDWTLAQTSNWWRMHTISEFYAKQT